MNHPSSIMRSLIRRLAATLAVTTLVMPSCSAPKRPSDDPAPAARVDLARYAGRWHEIARLPAPFQKDNEAAIAEYGMNADGSLSVRNIAVRPDGTQRDIKGSAKVLNPPENTKLAVRFDTWFGPLIPVPKEGNYWILHVDENYQQAVVGTPDCKYLWLLARTPEIPETRFTALKKKAEELGFDVARLIKTARK